MPDVKEVFDMVTQQTQPKPDALERQRKRQMRHMTNRRLGGFAAAAAVIGLAVFFTVRALMSGDEQPARPADSGPSVTVPIVPKVDYVIDLNSGEMTELPQTIIGSRAAQAHGRYAASPDGSTLAYVGLDGDSPQVFVAGIDGSGIHQVSHDPIGVLSPPAWSPDGTRITYVGHPLLVGLGPYSIFVLDVATGQTTRVIDVPRGDSTWPTFTPDGSSILYCAGTNSVPVLSIVPVTGGKSTVLFGRGRGGMADACGGSLSPDGSLVTMMGSRVGGGGAIRFVANADGTGLRHIPGRESNPAGTWSPDGSRIVARGLNESAVMGAIIVIDVATGTGTQVAEGSAAIWLDDHTLLVEV